MEAGLMKNSIVGLTATTLMCLFALNCPARYCLARNCRRAIVLRANYGLP